MLLSMTGFGKCAIQKDGRIVEVEVKSLNSRFLDLSVRLPKNFASKELEIREQIRKVVKRGKVSIYVTFKTENSSDSLFEMNETNLKSLTDMLNKIRSVSEIDSSVSLNDLFQFQSLFLSEKVENGEEDFKLISECIASALKELIEMRKQEGNLLQEDLFQRVELIEQKLVEIEKLKDTFIKEHFEKLQERAKNLYSNLQFDETRLNNELALLTDKMDITEECVRLNSHIKFFRETILNDAEAGRKLNFLLQEMNREANTINSKSTSTDISHLGIGIKEELEKIREQVQNIE